MASTGGVDEEAQQAGEEDEPTFPPWTYVPMTSSALPMVWSIKNDFDNVGVDYRHDRDQ